MSEVSQNRCTVVEHLPSDERRLVRRAQEFATSAHLGQHRVSGEPFIEHPLAVAEILSGLRPDTSTLVAAILHDVVEDTPATLHEIHTTFGLEIALLVDGVTKVVSYDELNDADCSIQTEPYCNTANFAKLKWAMVTDHRVGFIRLADRLHNMRTLSALPSVKQRRIAIETLAFYVPLAGYYGIMGFRSELCRLALSYIDRVKLPVQYPFLSPRSCRPIDGSQAHLPCAESKEHELARYLAL